jgi:hypothetical protein
MIDKKYPIVGRLSIKDGKVMENLYKAISVWRRISDTSAIHFNCLENLASKKFAVQSADFFYLPITEDQIISFEKQYLEFLIETSPDERCEWFESLGDAIAAHDRDFSNDN